MKILLVDADSHNGFPNLALMKLSAWYKQKGDMIDIIHGIPTTQPLETYDKAYISCLFFQNKEAILYYAQGLDIPYELGGSGVSYDNKLPDAIEHIKPDYSLYNTDYSMGFASRGCIRKCGFCIVPQKEGYICDNAPITEFHDPEHKKIILLDNNFLASPKWEQNLEYIIDHKLKVNFNSGLDIRLVNRNNAALLQQIMIQGWKFKKRNITFAFDSPNDTTAVVQGILTLRNAGMTLNYNNCMFYVLVGFNTTPHDDLERVRILKELGVSPFVMRYNKTKGQNRILMHLSRWVNRKYYEHMDFCDYDYSDSKKAYKLTFGNSPDSSYGGLGCPQVGYAWANRCIDEETDEIISIQKELEL